MPKIKIGNSPKKCYYCKREYVTHLAVIGQVEIMVCAKCGLKAKTMLEAVIYEIINPRTEEGKKRIKEMQENNSTLAYVSSKWKCGNCGTTNDGGNSDCIGCGDKNNVGEKREMIIEENDAG